MMIAVSYYNFLAKIRISTLFAERNAAYGQIRQKKTVDFKKNNKR
jgi:hypothetical protein